MAVDRPADSWTTVNPVHRHGRVPADADAGRLADVSDAAQPTDSAETHAIDPIEPTDAPESDRISAPDVAGRDDLDLDQIDADLTGVERALGRLDDGTYWTDEVTGAPLDTSVLEADPTATRNRTSA